MKAVKSTLIKLAFWLGHLGFIGGISMLLVWLSPAWAADTVEAVTGPGFGDASLAYISAALSTGLAAIAAGIAVASVGSAAIGAMAEKPEMLGRVLIVIGLAEGIAIYGLIISILILNRV